MRNENILGTTKGGLCLGWYEKELLEMTWTCGTGFLIEGAAGTIGWPTLILGEEQN